MAHNRVLIVGTIPYNKNTSSRAFDAYFHRWEKENIRQIFSNTKTPVKGHCGSLYQITDQRLLKRFFHKIREVGVIFNDKDLPEDWKDNDLEVADRLVDRLYRIGSKKTPSNHLARKWLWKDNYWNTRQLRDWLDEFLPECVFLAFSDDFFIPKIAMFVADRYQIPIMSCIGDDYYFIHRFSLSPLYHVYRRKYKKVIDQVFAHPSSAIYIGDKIRDRYNEYFHINGETVYLTSDIERREFKPIDLKNPSIVYCGNIRLGRNKSLLDIGNALIKINPEYRLHIYSAESVNKYYKIFDACPGIVFHGAVPYYEVMKITGGCDVTVIVEGFDKTDVDITRYSLSTKAADALASGVNVLAYGSPECGVIDYLASTGCAYVCTNPEKLLDVIKSMFSNVKKQEENYNTAQMITDKNHNKEKNWALSESLFKQLIDGNRRG